MKSKPKAVFDTNIFISAILFGGNPRQCLELARSGEVELFVSRAILVELAVKLRRKFLWPSEDVNEIIEGVLVFATLARPKSELSVIKADPSDNRVLECAHAAKVDYLVSGDKKHLLSLVKFRQIAIVSAKQFLDIYFSNSDI